MTEETRAGAIVGDGYELRERIDSGGLATVWRAIEPDRGVTVAVKCESDGVHVRELVRAHFRRELRCFRRFDGGPTPGSLVHFFEGTIGDDGAYVVTELIDGGSVDDIVGEDRAPGTDAVAAFGDPVCRAVEFLHRNGVLHLDLKPKNVLDRRRGPPAVIDLNSAVLREEGTATLFHHDPFKAPEVTPTDARDDPVGPRTDVYALGKLLFYLLTGTSVAFEDRSPSSWHAVDPLEYGAECTPELASVVLRATEPRPEDRYADAGELSDALAPLLDLPERTGVLEHAPSGRSIRVRPTDALGRWSADEPIPAVVVPDEERFVSPTQAVFDHDGRGWLLRDRSLNGTFVRKGSEWRYVLSEDGRRRRREADAPLPSGEVEPAIGLDDGDLIAPVSPRFDCRLRFRTS